MRRGTWPADEILRAHCVARREPMVARHQDDERLAVHDVILEVVAGLHAQEGAAMARDAASLVDSLGLERVDLFGFSMGGYALERSPP
jgi:pimeloyl-ACP methyl ester carboxylesterase